MGKSMLRGWQGPKAGRGVGSGRWGGWTGRRGIWRGGWQRGGGDGKGSNRDGKRVQWGGGQREEEMERGAIGKLGGGGG